MRRRTDWTEEGVSDHLCHILLDAKKGKGQNSSSKLPASLYADTVAAFLHFDDPLPNMLYVLGGRHQDKGPLDTVEMFDTWHGKWTQPPAMSTRRAGCAAAPLPDGRLCVVGGYDENGIVKGLLSSCEVFDPVAEKWSNIPELGRARWGHGCAAIGGKVYVIGGCSLRPGAQPSEAFMETLHNCEAYDPERNRWEPIEDMHVARAGSRLVALGESKHLAAVGGCDDVFGRAEVLPTVELYDLETRRWSLLDLRLRTPRTTAAVAALDEKSIMVVGGAPNLSSVEVYNVEEAMRRHQAGGGGHDNDDAEQGTEQEGRDRSDSTVPEVAAACGVGEGAARTIPAVADITEGRMGCQAVTFFLPKAASSGGVDLEDSQRALGYPLCTTECVAVIGGENGDEDWDQEQSNPAAMRQFSTALIFEMEAAQWRDEHLMPPMPTARTAMAVCVAKGRVRGVPR